MAVKQRNLIGCKIDDELKSKLDSYIDKYGADSSKVIKKALTEYLQKFESPNINKELKK